MGKEVGEECKTPHLQCYVYFANAKTLSAANKYIHKHCKRAAKIQAANGSPIQNFTYCSKDGDFIEKGTRPKGAGKRSDIDTIKEIVKSGTATQKELYEVSNSFQAMRFGQIGLQLYAKPRTEGANVIWRWGLAGTGKTRWAFDNFDINDIYVKDATRWWDGYENQKVILIDDFDNEWPYRDFLRLLDRYPYRAQVKGGYVVVNSEYIIITCEHPPDYYWQGNELAQVTRRLSEILEITHSTEVEKTDDTDTEVTDSVSHDTEVGGNNKPRPSFEEFLNSC